MRDYKARPGPRGRKPLRRPHNPRFKRGREPVPKGFQPLARPSAAKRERPHRVSRLLRALPRLPLRTLLTGAALLWLLAGLGYGGWRLWQEPLREVVLSGNEAVPAATVLKLGGLSAGLELGRIDPYETARRIGSHPRVISADVRRLVPGRVAIRLRERHADLRVRLTDGRIALVDPDNVVLSLLPARTGLPPELRALPLVAAAASSAEPSLPLRDPGIERGRAALAALQAQGYADPAHTVVDASDPFLITVRLPSGARLIVEPDRIDLALRTYRETLERYPLAFEGGGAVDLTTLSADGGGRIVLRRH